MPCHPGPKQVSCINPSSSHLLFPKGFPKWTISSQIFHISGSPTAESFLCLSPTWFGPFAVLLESITDNPLAGLEGHRQPKVPTLILYDNNYSTKFKWGGQVTWRDSAVRGVKLLLDPGQKRPAYLPASSYETGLRDLSAVAKDPVDAAADFIGAIYKHALSVIESAGIRDYFHFCQKDFVLSVPAVWSDKAKDLTLKARTPHHHPKWHFDINITISATLGRQEGRNRPCYADQGAGGSCTVHADHTRPRYQGENS